MNLKFYKNLYLYKNISNKDEIIEKIKNNINIFDLYLVCISKNINHTFEIFSLTEAFKDRYKNKDYTVIGMAYGKNQAFILIKDIFQDNIKDINHIKQKFIKNK
ncbi:hypothetical protein [[Clostridium] colinum]|uniref:hypothetical protein n=1 Tax=[Clostridium] colinum TaxID=36835 RepID=UPI002023FFE0|nr:hypothetical protein [[Clostridium] colinum]